MDKKGNRNEVGGRERVLFATSEEKTKVLMIE